MPIGREWQGQTAVVLGGGPSLASLTAADLRDIFRSRCKVIAVNRAFEICPGADILFWSDRRFARGREDAIRAFRGRKATTSHTTAKRFGADYYCPSPHINQNAKGCRIYCGPPIETKPTLLAGLDSGHRAVNLAVHLGARRVILLGFDMKADADGRCNFHDGHVDDFGNGLGQKPEIYSAQMIPAWTGVWEAARRLGCDIVNATPGSALSGIPYKPLRDALPPMTRLPLPTRAAIPPDPCVAFDATSPAPPPVPRRVRVVKDRIAPVKRETVPPPREKPTPERRAPVSRFAPMRKTESLRTIVTFLWDQPDLKRNYRFEHAELLADQLERWMKTPYRFVLIADHPQDTDRKMEVIQTPPAALDLGKCRTPEDFNRYPSSYRRLWLFSDAARDIGEHVLLTDVDVVVTADWSHLFDYDADFVGWQPGMGWGNLEDRLAGGMHCLRTGTHREVYEDFIRDPEAAIQAARAAGFRGSDQAWISYKLVERVPVWPKEAGVFSVRDMTRDQRFVRTDKPPDGACVCHFNGNLNPWDDALQRMHPWIKQYLPQKVNA